MKKSELVKLLVDDIAEEGDDVVRVAIDTHGQTIHGKYALYTLAEIAEFRGGTYGEIVIGQETYFAVEEGEDLNIYKMDGSDS